MLPLSCDLPRTPSARFFTAGSRLVKVYDFYGDFPFVQFAKTWLASFLHGIAQASEKFLSNQYVVE